jgi:ribosome recycling factor
MADHPLVKDCIAKMQKNLEHTLQEFAGINTGKASPAMVEGILVEAYGSNMRLKECAAIHTPDPRMISVQPWDKSLLKPIEKAIQMANIGINPIIDGPCVRLPLPEMSKERRQELTKVAHRLAEEGRVAIRNTRRDGVDLVKKALKDGKITEDDSKKIEKDVQAVTDRLMKDIGDSVAKKEQELLKV